MAGGAGRLGQHGPGASSPRRHREPALAKGLAAGCGAGGTGPLRRGMLVVHSGQMRIRHAQMTPSVHPDAYVAPTAVLSGEVRIGRGSCILHGAVLSADGGPVEIGASCVIMEHAVLRGTPRHQLTVGDHVLAGPHSCLTGCRIGDEVFIATSAMVFNGAQMGRASSVALGGAVHRLCGTAADPDPDRLGGGRQSRATVSSWRG